MRLEEVTLANLQRGAAVERFNDELGKVVANILDPNTPAEAVRSVTLMLKIKPAQDRTQGAMVVQVVSKLAPPAATAGIAFFGTKEGVPVVVERDPAQAPLFDSEQPEQEAPAPRAVK